MIPAISHYTWCAGYRTHNNCNHTDNDNYIDSHYTVLCMVWRIGTYMELRTKQAVTCKQAIKPAVIIQQHHIYIVICRKQCWNIALSFIAYFHDDFPFVLLLEVMKCVCFPLYTHRNSLRRLKSPTAITRLTIHCKLLLYHFGTQSQGIFFMMLSVRTETKHY